MDDLSGKNRDFDNVSLFDLVERQNIIETLNSEIIEANRAKYHTYLTKQLQAHMIADSFINVEDDNVSNNRDLIGYNVIRDGIEVGFTENNLYDDSNVTPGIEYCYVVVAVYDEGESSASNQDCAAASSPPNPVGLSVIV